MAQVLLGYAALYTLLLATAHFWPRFWRAVLGI